MVLAMGCGHSARVATDGGSDTGATADAANPLADATGPTADAAPDGPPPWAEIPPGDLGAITLTGTCSNVYRGWSFSDAFGCSPDDTMSTGAATRQVTIAGDGSGGYLMTTAWTDEPTTIDISQATPMVTAGDLATCDPIGQCIEHDWTLSAHSLALATHFLHDNSSSVAIPQCWEYYYQSQDCTFTLAW